jgi:hypothetical protein
MIALLEPFEKPHFTGSFYINLENVEDLVTDKRSSKGLL